MTEKYIISKDEIDRNTVEKQRLRKKVEKLKQQRDHWKEQYDKMHYIMVHYPYFKREYNSSLERADEKKKFQEMEKRVREQELLIRLLRKDDLVTAYEIQKAYEEMITESYNKLDESQKYKKVR